MIIELEKLPRVIVAEARYGRVTKAKNRTRYILQISFSLSVYFVSLSDVN